MTKFMSRTDVYYGLSFVAALAAVLVGQLLAFLVTFAVPLPDLPNGSIAANIAQIKADYEHYNMLVNAVTAGVTTLVFGMVFFGFSLLVKRLGAKLQMPGIWLGTITAVLLMAAITMTTLSVASYSPGNISSPNISVWVDLFTALIVAGSYALALFFALHYSKFVIRKEKRK